MEAAIWIGLVLDVTLLVWLFVSVQSMKVYLRRIAISLPITPEQMGLITGTIRTEEAMAIFVKAEKRWVTHETDASFGVDFDTSEVTSTLDQELMGLRGSRQYLIATILGARQESMKVKRPLSRSQVSHPGLTEIA